ncbi:MAG: primosomal protein N', partial [Burkholderiales bacterium]
LEQVPVILGSATPSLETFAHATSGRYERLRILRRAVTDAVLPTIRLLDLNSEPQNHGVATTIWSAIAERLARGEQSLLFLNRRGYAPVLSCASCGWVSACSRCTAYLVMHRARGQTTGGTLRCHHCGHFEPVHERCPTCGNVDIRGYGQGTQRLEARLAEAYPAARVLRVDRDSTARKGSAEALLDQVHAGEADILVGTQMLAKGHDFKNLTLVAALNVDAALLSADFRASERLFAQMTQVAGRAGRADKPGLVLIQTRQSGHPLFQALLSGDYDRFAARLLAEREAAGLPPAGYQAMLRAEARGLDAALGFLTSAAEAAAPMGQGVTIYDPVPMLITRLKDVERAQLMVESRSRPHLQAFLTRWVEWLSANAPSSVRWHVEVDPLVI